jgi:CRP-like cAMP-binding protein
VQLRNRNRPDISALRLIGIDAGLTRAQLEQLALHTDVVDVPAGEPLSRAGRQPRQLLAVVDGYVDVIDATGCGRIAGPGTVIGGIELVDGVPLAETVCARSDCRLVVIFGPAVVWAARATGFDANPSPIVAWLRAGLTSPTPLVALAS